jgi:hypothetical protein
VHPARQVNLDVVLSLFPDGILWAETALFVSENSRLLFLPSRERRQKRRGRFGEKPSFGIPRAGRLLGRLLLGAFWSLARLWTRL